MSLIDRVRGWLKPAPRAAVWGCNKEGQFERDRVPVKRLLPDGYSGLAIVLNGEKRTPEDWEAHIEQLEKQLKEVRCSERTLTKRIREFQIEQPDLHYSYFTRKGIHERNKMKGI